MQQQYPFQPIAGAASTLNIAVTASNQTFTLPSPPNSGGTMRLVNSGSQVVFWAYGTVTSAVATSTPMLPGTVETFTLPGGVTTLSVIAGATGSTLYATIGEGM